MRTHEYFPDLTSFETTRSLFPRKLRVGWLSPENEFERGPIDSVTLANLKEFLFAYVHCQDCKAQGLPEPAFSPTVTLMRHLPHACALSKGDHVVTLEPKGLKYYRGDKNFTLGNTHFSLRHEDGNLSYYFPSLMYHYIDAHGYLPPVGFLDAVKALDFSIPYSDSGDLARNELVAKQP